MAKERFEEYLTEDLERCKGVIYPIRADTVERLLVRKVECDRLHANPDDEFCDPEIGPSGRIISEYQSTYVDAIRRGFDYYIGDPIIVEKVHPDGYMIVNGHHRWAAAFKLGQKKIPVKIVNLTRETDVREMLKKARHNRRAVLDLDEVVFNVAGGAVEKPLDAPWNRIYKEPVRLGVPALFRFLNTAGYDVWLYSGNYYSYDYIQKYFACYQVAVNGVVTGTDRGKGKGREEKKKMEDLITERYKETLHIDDHMLVRIKKGRKEFDDYPLKGSSSNWSQEIMEIIGGFEDHEDII